MAVALAEMAIAGRLGLSIDTLPGPDTVSALFSESSSRFVCELASDDVAWLAEILDEPNAFLDAQGESALLRAIEATLKRGAAVVMIAHRKSVLHGATRLLVLDAGRPKMIGPAAEVAARLVSPGEESAA